MIHKAAAVPYWSFSMITELRSHRNQVSQCWYQIELVAYERDLRTTSSSTSVDRREVDCKSSPAGSVLGSAHDVIP